ncbi:MAG: hypothetical protein IJT88_07450 [Kiritimatiellae bacterium]|nr:hypothetical protein [Kiritimatiellia bacterium]
MKNVVLALLILACGILAYFWLQANGRQHELVGAVADARARLAVAQEEVATRQRQADEADAQHQADESTLSELQASINAQQAAIADLEDKIARYDEKVRSWKIARTIKAEEREASLDSVRAAREGRTLGIGETEAKRYVARRGDYYFFTDGLGDWYARRSLADWSPEALAVVQERDTADRQLAARRYALLRTLREAPPLSPEDQAELDQLEAREQQFADHLRDLETQPNRLR